MRTSESRSNRRQTVLVPAKSIYNVSFMDTAPNSVYVRNNGEANIYIGFHTTPTAEDCDIKIKAGSVKTYGEQNPFARMMIYNESGSPAKVIVTSWESSIFDPSLLQGDIEVTTGDALEALKYDGIIKGFSSSLPAGTNNIGGVNVQNNPWKAADIQSIVSLLEDILEKSGGGASASVENSVTREGEIEAGSYTTVIGTGRISTLSNDSEGTLSISVLDVNGNQTTTMAIYPGEVITDIPFKYGFTINGDINLICAFRVVYSLNS